MNTGLLRAFKMLMSIVNLQAGDLTRLVLPTAQAGECQQSQRGRAVPTGVGGGGQCPIQTIYCITGTTQRVCCGGANTHIVKGIIWSLNPHSLSPEFTSLPSALGVYMPLYNLTVSAVAMPSLCGDSHPWPWTSRLCSEEKQRLSQ